MSCRNIRDVSTVMFTDKAQTVTGRKTFAKTAETFVVSGAETSPIYNFSGKNGNWQTYDPLNITSGIINGLAFQWYNQTWVIGAIRGGSDNTIGFGIGLLKADNTIEPIFRLTQGSILFKETKITE